METFTPCPLGGETEELHCLLGRRVIVEARWLLVHGPLSTHRYILIYLHTYLPTYLPMDGRMDGHKEYIEYIDAKIHRYTDVYIHVYIHVLKYRVEPHRRAVPMKAALSSSRRS